MLFLIGAVKVLGVLSAIIQIHLLFPEPQTGLFGDISISISWIFMIVNAISNMLMTLMIAGRVWWLSRSLQKGLPSGVHLSHDWYHRTLAVVTESGMIYPVYLTLQTILLSDPVDINIPNYVCIGTIIVGLAPTLIAVRVGLGSTVDNQSLPSATLQSELIFATHPRSPFTHVLDIAPAGDEDISARSSIRDAEKGLREVELQRAL